MPQKIMVNPMSDVKTITAREIQQITSTFEEKTKYIMWHGKRIKITPLISMEEVFKLVSKIMCGCTRRDDNIVIPESVDFVFRVKVIEAYGNIRLPEDVDEQYRIVYGTDIVCLILNEINQNQLNAIQNIIYAYTGVKI